MGSTQTGFLTRATHLPAQADPAQAGPAPEVPRSAPASKEPATPPATTLDYPLALTPFVAPLLVVDDEQTVLEALKATLEHEGYRVETFSDPGAAVQRLERQTFSVVLTDQRMPGLTGLELLARVRELQPDATRLLITGLVDLNTTIACINTGEVYRFIVKPWLREELLVTIRNAAQRYELLGRNRELQRMTLVMNEELKALNLLLRHELEREAAQRRQLTERAHSLEQEATRAAELLALPLEQSHPTLGARSRRAAWLCRALAEGLQLAPEEARTLEWSAWLHDLGLLGLPRALVRRWLWSPEALRPTQLKWVQQHPARGQSLVEPWPSLNPLGRVIRAHHERYDGRGFPDGLAGDQIPWLARVLAVALAFVSHEGAEVDALEAVQRASGSAFDPDAVRALLWFRPKPTPARRAREVPLTDLRPGMVAAKGIYSSNGLLLISEGQTLSDVELDRLRDHHRVGRIRDPLVVYC